MVARILIFSLIFLITTLSGISLVPSTAVAGPYSARACAKIYERARFIQSRIKSAQAGMSIRQREVSAIKAKLNVIQTKRRRIGCIYPSRLERSDIRKCTRLTKQRMKLLRKKDAVNKKWNQDIRWYNRAVRDQSYIRNIELACKNARRARSRRIIEREGREPHLRHSRASSAAGIAVIRGIGAAIQKRINRKKSRRRPAIRRKCHRNPRTGVLDCGSN